MTQEFASGNKPDGIEPPQIDQAPNLAAFEALDMPYRPVGEYPRSIIPADSEAGLSACVIETQKDFLRDDGQLCTRTIAEQNFSGDRHMLVIDYFEPEDRMSSMQVRFSRNGVEPSEASAIHQNPFPMSVREDELNLSGDETLKGVIHEALYEFRLRGEQGFLQCVRNFAEQPESVHDNLQIDLPPTRDFALIGNISELHRAEFKSHGLDSVEPFPVIMRVPAPNIGIALEHESGVQMTLNFLPVLKGNAEPKYILQQVRLALPAKGWTSVVPFTDSHERYFIDAQWIGETADLDLQNGQVQSLIKSYNEILADYHSGELGKIADYFNGMMGFHAVFAENIHSRFADRYRQSRLDS